MGHGTPLAASPDERNEIMTPERWQQVKGVLQEALELTAEQRCAFLDRACSGDTLLRQEVESMLKVEPQADGFLEDSIRIVPQLEKDPGTGAQVGIPEPARSPTLEFIANYDSKSGDWGRLNLRLARGFDSAQSLEIRDLLHRRLQIMVLIALIASVFLNATRFVRLEKPLFTNSNIWHLWVPAAFNFAVQLALTVMLWRKRLYTLAQLRWFEAVAFGITTLYFLSDTYFPLFEFSRGPGGYLLEYAQRYPQEIIAVSRLVSILWAMLIMGYGTFIPNTGRRCAAVTISMALSCLTLVTVAGLLHPVIPRRLLMLFLADMTLWLGCAVAIAIYGSQKITALRQEAFAARKLGQYDLKQRLGIGGMGEVYLAEHVLLKRPCAVKVIRPDEARNPSVLRRFLREVQMTATLTHPNTVQVFDYGQTDDGTVFYAMEYLPGLNLEKFVGQYGVLPAQRVIYVLQQLCGALAEAHAIGLIHRDIKPSNVILCNRGGLYDVAKLLDFGLVRMKSTDDAVAGATQDGLIFGTPAYMSPEQALGNTELDIRSDIYSLGALAWFLALGEPPFVRDGAIQTLAAHINEPAPLLRSRSTTFPEDLADIVQRCLAKDPDNRFPDVTSLENALVKCRSAGAWTQTLAAAWWSSVTTAAQSSPV